MILTHGANSIQRTLPELQLWTNQSVPQDTVVLHDFGNGPEPAVPYDNCGVSNDVVFTEVKPYYMGNCGVSNDVVFTEVKPYYMGNCGVSNDVVSVEIITA